MSTEGKDYADRLRRLQTRWWKRWLDVQRPYRWNLKRLNLGATLDVGCGIGRSLVDLPAGSVGIDHNRHAIAEVRSQGLLGFTPEEFANSPHCNPNCYDSLLFGHVLEHMSEQEARVLVAKYLPCLKHHGRVIVLAPQESGFKADPTHVTFLDFAALGQLLGGLELIVESSYSFPFSRKLGPLFRYNEFVVVARRPRPGL